MKTFKFQNRELALNLPTEADQSVFEEIFRDREYRSVEDLIKKAKHPILDIGAHIGLFALYAATLNPKAQIYSFEPEENNYQALKSHLKENRISSVISKNLAVADTDRGVELSINQDSHNHSIYLSGDTKKVPSITLERIFQKFRLEKVSLAKIDCEGAEFDILLKTPDEILKKIQTYFIEYHQYTPEMNADKLTARLQSLGYKTKKTPSRYDKRMGMIVAFTSK